ncbi:MAG: M50 family metallopeptidase [Bacteroidales bacterium]|jgi:hypothetical protein|nr:M50 family metallopeptidase [Bacteroidales bacterium]
MNIFFDIIIFISFALLAYWISAVIHELGHVVVGLAHGWKLFMFVVGPIGIKRKEDGLHLYFEKNVVLWFGVGGTLPVKNDADNMKVWAKILLGGPIASLLAGILFLAIFIIHPNLVWLLLGAIPIGMGIACLLPLKTGISYSDGKRWHRIHKGGKGKAEETALFNMIMIDQFCKDYVSIQKSDFEALLDSKNSVLRYYGLYFSYRYYDAHNDFDNKSLTLDALHKMEKDVPKFIVDDCKL